MLVEFPKNFSFSYWEDDTRVWCAIGKIPAAYLFILDTKSIGHVSVGIAKNGITDTVLFAELAQFCRLIDSERYDLHVVGFKR